MPRSSLLGRTAGAVLSAFVIFTSLAAVHIGAAPPADAASPRPYADAIRVEVRGKSSQSEIPYFLVTGDDPGRYAGFRKGAAFGYLLSNLPASGDGKYEIELSFSEVLSRCPTASTFDVTYAGGEEMSKYTPLTGVNICSSGAAKGAVKAFSVRIVGITAPGRELLIELAAVTGEASLSAIRVGPTGSIDGGTATGISAAASRLETGAAIGILPSKSRLTDFSKLNVHEVPLSRFGARALISPSPQMLGWRQSPLGTGAVDLSEFVVAVRRGSTIRAMPFTDRYALFDTVAQSDWPTGASFVAEDPALGLRVRLDLRAPFWPQDEAVTTLPAFYAELSITNTAGTPAGDTEAIVALPFAYDARDGSSCAGCGPQFMPAPDMTGVAWGSLVASGPDARPSAGEAYGSRTVQASEAIAIEPSELPGVALVAGVGANGRGQSDWLWSGPGAGVGFERPYAFERKTRGHAGFKWTPGSLGAGAGSTRRFVIAAHTLGDVMRVTPPANPSLGGLYRFTYADTYADITSVTSAAVAGRVAQSGRADAFDALLSDPAKVTLPGDAQASQAMRELMAMGFRSYVANAWMMSKEIGSGGGPSRWYTVWEGSTPCCAFNSTVDVAYNDSQLLLAFWPDLLDQLLEEWKLFTGTGVIGTELQHDMGGGQVLAGQAYYSMPVEEAANYALLAYAHWKATGDDSALAGRISTAKDLMDAAFAADNDDDGLADEGVSNTIDASNSVQHSSRGQVYLGVKTLAAAQGLIEAMDGAGLPDAGFAQRATEHRHKVVHTLENAAWRGDHFAVSVDPREQAASLRNARSIYASNGLLYLLQFGGDLPISPSLNEKLRADATSALGSTLGPAGSIHMEAGTTGGWVSQNIWRDAVSSYLGAEAESVGDFFSLAPRYRDLELEYARWGNGGWWDVFEYYMGPGNTLELLGEGGGRGPLGYYPRGSSAFAMPPAAGGITIDRVNGVIGALTPARPGAKVPLYALADWPSGTVPIATATGATPTISGSTPATSGMIAAFRPASAPSIAAPEAISPNGDGEDETATVTVTGLTSGTAGISVGHSGYWVSGEQPVLGGSASLVWDGLDGGSPAGDAAGSACAFESPAHPRELRMGACAPLGVNTNTPGPSTRWYLAEGSTDHGFEDYILVQNPSPSGTAMVALTYMTPSGPRPMPPVAVPPLSRRTFAVAAQLGASDHSTRVESDLPVVAERAMYWRDPAGAYREGHAAVGATRARDTWYLPEGSTDHGFSEYILLQNPGPADVDATVSLRAEDGRAASVLLAVPAGSRRTVNAADVIGAADVAATVSAPGGVVAERAQYWGGVATGGGSGSGGMVAPSRTWYLAEGSTAWGLATFVLLQNPGSTEAAVNIVYNTASGSVARAGLTMPPNSRRTITVADDLPGADTAIFVQASQPVLAERSMFYGANGGGASAATGGHVSGGNPTPAKEWNVAEGTTAYGFDEYLLVQNPGAAAASVLVEFQRPAGPPIPLALQVPAGSRVTVHVNDYVPASDVSASVRSSEPVIVERAMYTRGGSGAFQAGTAASGSR